MLSIYSGLPVRLTCSLWQTCTLTCTSGRMSMFTSGSSRPWTCTSSWNLEGGREKIPLSVHGRMSIQIHGRFDPFSKANAALDLNHKCLKELTQFGRAGSAKLCISYLLFAGLTSLASPPPRPPGRTARSSSPRPRARCPGSRRRHSGSWRKGGGIKGAAGLATGNGQNWAN